MKPHSLLEFLTASRPSDPSAGSAFPGVLSPSTTSLGLAPCEAGYHSRPGSALRFSQPPSGFPADPSFAALFHAATVPGVLPSESSPHRNRAPLSRPPAPLWLSTRVQDAASWILLPPVSPTPTLSRSCLVPRDGYRLPFHAPKHASRLPWIQATELARSASFTHFEALILLRVRPHQPESPRTSTSLLSWVSASLELSLPTPRDLDPPGPRGPAHAPSSGDSAHGPEDLTPPRPGEVVPTHECPETTSSTASGTLEGRPAPPLDGVRYSPGLGTPGRNPQPLTFEALKYVESGFSPKRSPSLLRFPASSRTS